MVVTLVPKPLINKRFSVFKCCRKPAVSNRSVGRSKSQYVPFSEEILELPFNRGRRFGSSRPAARLRLRPPLVGKIGCRIFASDEEDE
jgi:hypothetical protein